MTLVYGTGFLDPNGLTITLGTGAVDCKFGMQKGVGVTVVIPPGPGGKYFAGKPFGSREMDGLPRGEQERVRLPPDASSFALVGT